MDDQYEDAWGVIGEKVECKSCEGAAVVDGEVCPGCLGYGWLCLRADGE